MRASEARRIDFTVTNERELQGHTHSPRKQPPQQHTTCRAHPLYITLFWCFEALNKTNDFSSKPWNNKPQQPMKRR